MIEPLEETRSELTFVTEVITASLHTILQAANGQPRQSDRGRPPSGSSVAAGHVDLDEVEIQKGTLQIAKGLAFLHTQARMVHLNLSPESILVNAKVGHLHKIRWPRLMRGLRETGNCPV